eukprot:c28231_g1_i1 orf=96-2144(+)
MQMARKMWQNPDLDSEDEDEDVEEAEEEIAGSEDETDEEEEKKFDAGEENYKSTDGEGDDQDEVSSEEDSEEDRKEGDVEAIGGASKINPLVEDRRAEGRMEKVANVEEYDSSSGYDSEESSDEETPKCIATILASDRVTSGDGNVRKVGSGGGKVSRAGVGVGQAEGNVVRNSTSEFQKRARDEGEGQKGTPAKRRKENGSRDQDRKSPITEGKAAHSQTQKGSLQIHKPEQERISSPVQIAQPNKKRTETAPKNSRNKKHILQDESQTQDSKTNEEARMESNGPQRSEKVIEKKAEKKHRGPEDANVPSACIQLESESKMKNQKQQRSVPPAENELKFPQSQESLSLQKQKRPAAWSSDDEIALANGVKRHLKYVGEKFPGKADHLWDKICEKLHEHRTKDQLYDKVRRMKCRYKLIAEKTKAECSVPFSFKNEHEEHLFKIWKQIWGGEESEKHEEEQTAAGEDHGTSKSVVKTKPSNPRKKVQVEKELLPARGKQDETMDQEVDDAEEDASETLEECATPSDLDKPHLPTSALAILANVSMTSGPLESSADLMQQQQNTSALNNTVDCTLAQPGSENTSMTEILKLMHTSNQALLEEVQSHCKHLLEDVQAKTKAIVENTVKSAAKGFQFHNGLDCFIPCSFSMPFLATGGAMDIKLPNCNKEARDKLMQQWHEQHLQ